MQQTSIFFKDLFKHVKNKNILSSHLHFPIYQQLLSNISERANALNMLIYTNSQVQGLDKYPYKKKEILAKPQKKILRLFLITSIM